MGCFCLPLPQVTNALLGVVPLARNKITDKTTKRKAFRMECFSFGSPAGNRTRI